MTAAVGPSTAHAVDRGFPPQSRCVPRFAPSQPAKRVRRLSPRPTAAQHTQRALTTSSQLSLMMAVEEDDGELGEDDGIGEDDDDEVSDEVSPPVRSGVLPAPPAGAPSAWASSQHAARPQHPVAAAVRIAAYMPAHAHLRRAAPGVSRLRQSFSIGNGTAGPAPDATMHPVAAALREAHPAF